MFVRGSRGRALKGLAANDIIAARLAELNETQRESLEVQKRILAVLERDKA